MKKILSIFLCVSFLLCLAACQEPEETHPGTRAETTESTTQETTVANETTIQVDLPHIPAASVTLAPTTEAEVLKDGTVLFEYNYPTINLVLPDGEMSEAVMLDFLNRIDATRSDAEDVKEAAGEYYTGKSGWTTYFYNLTYSPMRIDTGVLSLYGLESVFSGGIHPNHNACAVNYDLTTGKTMKLRHILFEEVTADTLIRLVCDSLQKQEASLFSDYALCVEDRFAGDFGADDQWYLSDTGLCFFFSPYEVGPYTSGTIVAEISYDQLSGILRDDFFPGETTASDGMIRVQALEDMSTLGEYSSFTEVTLDAEGESILITASDLIYQVKIEIGDWNSDGTVFLPRSTVYASNVLNESDAIILKTAFSSGLPNIRIVFTSGIGTQGYYLALHNGNITLTAMSN